MGLIASHPPPTQPATQPATQACALMGIEPLSSQAGTQSTEPHQPGPGNSVSVFLANLSANGRWLVELAWQVSLTQNFREQRFVSFLPEIIRFVYKN